MTYSLVELHTVPCRRTIYDDAFIRQYIEDLLKNIRTQVVLKLIQPYTRIRIPFISRWAISTSLRGDAFHTLDQSQF